MFDLATATALRDHAVDAFEWLWLIWFCVAQWLGGRWLRMLNRPVGGIYQEAKRGNLRLLGPGIVTLRWGYRGNDFVE